MDKGQIHIDVGQGEHLNVLERYWIYHTFTKP